MQGLYSCTVWQSLLFEIYKLHDLAAISIKEFYKDIFHVNCPDLDHFLSSDKNEFGHFNVFNINDVHKNCIEKPKMPYNRRTYYKISLIKGKNIVEYADRVVKIDDYAVLFATPKIPYNYNPLDARQEGFFCVFTKDFLPKSKIGQSLDDFPIFNNNSHFVFKIDAKKYSEMAVLYDKMERELKSDYLFKYDLLRNYVVELIHEGQKLSPLPPSSNKVNAASRISTLFIELLERQFPLDLQRQSLQLTSANDYAKTLGIHVNHLNKVLRTTTGKSTSEIISSRIILEAKILLKQTQWNVSEIAQTLGFEEVAHFSNFFKKNTNISPIQFRE